MLEVGERKNWKTQGAWREMSIIVPRACGWGCYSNKCFLSRLLVAIIETPRSLWLYLVRVCSAPTFSINGSAPDANTPLCSAQLKG
jgi:hypothetical protein